MLTPWDVDDELWAVIEPLLPKVERRARHPGRKRHPDRLVFQGILFRAAHRDRLGSSASGAWFRIGHDLLAPSGGMDRGRVWPRLHEVLLTKLRGANALDFSRAAVDGSHVRALKGAEALLTGADQAVSSI
jgi:transposase